MTLVKNNQIKLSNTESPFFTINKIKHSGIGRQDYSPAVCDCFNKKQRKALIVMATGTGKTRCAISIVDVLRKPFLHNQ